MSFGQITVRVVNIHILSNNIVGVGDEFYARMHAKTYAPILAGAPNLFFCNRITTGPDVDLSIRAAMTVTQRLWDIAITDGVWDTRNPTVKRKWLGNHLITNSRKIKVLVNTLSSTWWVFQGAVGFPKENVVGYDVATFCKTNPGLFLDRPAPTLYYMVKDADVDNARSMLSINREHNFRSVFEMICNHTSRVDAECKVIELATDAEKH
jgi:hypothetical protein